MTIAVVLSDTLVAPGNSASVGLSVTGAGASDAITFGFSLPAGLTVTWSGGTVGGILGVTLASSSTIAPGAYTAHYTWVDTTANVSGTGTFQVTVTNQVYPYALAGPNPVTRALGRLTSAFANKANVKGVLASLLVGVPELENVFWQIINNRIFQVLIPLVNAGTGTGIQIDQIGGLVGEPRQGRVDASYLPAVMVRIRSNRSKGRAEDVIQVANMLRPGSQYDEVGVDAFYVTMYDVTPGSIPTISSLIGRSKAVGTRGVLEFSTWPSSENLVLDYTAGHPVPTATVLDYTAGHPVSGAGLLTGFTPVTPV